MANEILLSQEGYEKLRNELSELKTTERQKIAEAIREAKSHGDLRENAMYHEAKLNQKRLDGRIADLERVLQLAKVVEGRDEDGSATLNSKVTVKDLKFGDELTWTLVGSYEADPANDRISVTSPLGEAMFGKTVGEEITFEAPAGVQTYKILAIE